MCNIRSESSDNSESHLFPPFSDPPELLNAKNSFDFEFCRIFKSLSVLFEPPSDGWHPHRIGLVYIVCADTDGSFQAPPGTRYEPKFLKLPVPA